MALALGLALGLPFGQGAGASVPSLGIAKLLVVVGDSNGRGWAEDQGSLVFTPTANIKTFVSAGSFQTYDPATATGMEGGVNTTWVGPELSAAQALRTADATKPVFIFKNAVTGTKQTDEWKVAGGGANPLVAPTKALLAQAISAMAALGYTAEVQIIVSLGINESTARQQYQAEARLLYADMIANWGVVAATRISTLRSSIDNSNMVCIRAAQQVIGHENARDYLIDADAFGKGADITHYNLAGQTASGNAWAAIILGGAGFDTDFLLPQMGFYDNTAPAPNLYYGFTLPGGAGWSVPATVMTAAAVPAFGAATMINDLPLEAGVTYTLEYDLVVTTGSFRWTMTGGTSKNGTTQTTTGHKTETIVANASNVRLAVNAAGSGFTGTISNATLRKI